MEQDKPVHSGILWLPPVGKRLLKKTWPQKFCMLYKPSKFGIERLEVYDSVDDATASRNSPSRIITLENCVKINQKSQTYITVITKTNTYEFATATQQSAAEWLVALQSVAFRDDASRLTSIEEDNDLYCSSGEGVFNVRVHPSEASKRCGLEPKYYTLVLTSTAIQLRNCDDDKLLYTWPYRFIRRYGYRDGKFTFEAGRKCDSGEGTFHLEYSNQQEIFRCVATKMKSMKKLLNGESTPSMLDCGDNQFHAALSMEARSRSPLPPSPTTSTSLHDIESQVSTKSLSSATDTSVDKKSFLSSVTSLKPKPKKPPRKTLLEKQEPDKRPIMVALDSCPGNKFRLNHTIPSKYDEIEYRSEAWKLLGTDEPSHTENISTNNESLEDYVSWGRLKTEVVNEQKPPKASKIITHSIVSTPEEESYDKLNFFGSSSKLNVTKSGYKQVTPVPIQPVPYVPSFNDYDEVEPSMEGVRIADDSHLGYALIRKPSPKEPPVDHQFHNNDPYAVISKPKRV